MKKYVLASDLNQQAKEKLNLLGFEVISFHDNESVGRKIRNHADLSFFDCNDGTLFIAAEMSEYKTIFQNLGYEVRILSHKLGEKYPYDVPLNCLTLGEYLICNVDTVSSDVLKYFRDKKVNIVNVRQGYTKCSVIPVNGHAIITDDKSIGKKCKEYNIDVLTVSKGSVLLDGFDYGFIGGTAGKLSDTQIAFNGDINTHTDCEKIIDFLKKHNMQAVSLADGPLYDIGSIIVL